MFTAAIPVVPLTQTGQQTIHQAKIMGVQNLPQHPNHDLSQQKPIVQHQNQLKQHWNHTGQITSTQIDDRQSENKSSDWAPNNQLPHHQVAPNYQSEQEMFGQMQQVHVQSSQVPMGYMPGQPQQTSQLAQMNVVKVPNQQPGRFSKKFC